MLTVKKRWSPRVNSFIRGGILGLALVDLVMQIALRKINFGIENHGVSFGLFSQTGVWLNYFLLLVVLGFWWYFLREKERGSLAILAILSGGLVNLVSRIFFGSVWDYLFIPLTQIRNNFSDILISLGIVAYLLGF